MSLCQLKKSLRTPKKLQFFDIIRFKQNRKYLPVDPLNHSPEVSVPPQLGKLQKHNSDSGEENTKIRVDNANSEVSCLSSIYSKTTSSVPASRTVSFQVTVNHVLRGQKWTMFPAAFLTTHQCMSLVVLEVTEG
jgi:hypothetical protein